VPVDSVAMGKGGQDELALGVSVVGEEWIIDAAGVEESFVFFEAARLLGAGLTTDPLICGSNSSLDEAQEESFFGSL
jgi:hypothetical protein